MDIDTAALLAEANAHAQRRFHAMLEAKVFGDPENPLTRQYVLAERVVDDLLGEAQWEASKAAMDEAQAGDHYAGMAR
jgi:hypothetical protein